MSGRLCQLLFVEYVDVNREKMRPREGSFLRGALPDGCVFAVWAAVTDGRYDRMHTWRVYVLSRSVLSEHQWMECRSKVAGALGMGTHLTIDGVEVIYEETEGMALDHWKKADWKGSDVVWTGSLGLIEQAMR